MIDELSPQINSIQTGNNYSFNRDNNEAKINQFVDLCWFLRENAVDKTKDRNELELISMSLNLNFGNIRINCYLDAFKYLHGQTVFLPKEALTISSTLYPSSIFSILNLKNSESYYPIEQLYIPYDSNIKWHNEITKTKFEKQNDRIRVVFVQDNRPNYYYIFKEKQMKMLDYVLNYVLNNGPSLVVNARKK